MSLYLLDANVLIDANRDYYPPKRVPEFWDWLLHKCRTGYVKIPQENYDEIVPLGNVKKMNLKKNRVKLINWLKTNGSQIVLNESLKQLEVDNVVRNGYANNPTSAELDKMGADPYLISYAYRDRQGRTVVTTETTKPTATRANRKIPDVCDALGVRPINTYKFIEELNFKTKWNH